MKRSQPVGQSLAGRAWQRALWVLCFVLCVGATSGCALFDGFGGDEPSEDKGADIGPGIEDVADGDAPDEDVDVDDIQEEDVKDADDASDAPEECDAATGECDSPFDPTPPLADGMCPDPEGCGGIRQIAAGSTFACALSMAGEVRCWGENNMGQLGNNVGGAAGEHSSQPILVGGALAGKPVSAITAGEQHACALVPSHYDPQAGENPVAAAIYCWGSQANGRLGNNQPSGFSGPISVALTQLEETDRQLTPSAFTAGKAHSCLLDDANSIRCWGSNVNAQLGLGARGLEPFTTDHWEVSTNYPVSTNLGEADGSGAIWLKDMAAVSTTEILTCAWGRESSSFWCWGGTGSTDVNWGSFAQEFALPSAGTWGDETPKIIIEDVAPGYSHACIVTRNTIRSPVARDIYCWGQQINSTYRDTETLVLDLPGREEPDELELVRVKLSPELWGEGPLNSLASGKYFSCMISAEGKVYCWGYNSSGQLGLGVARTVDTENGSPVLFDDTGHGYQPLTGMVALALGNDFGCSLSAEGEIWCWGRNNLGQLGSPSLSSNVGVCSTDGRLCRPYAEKLNFED